MAGELAAVGLVPIVAPLLAAESTQASFPANRYDHVIFVSEHAVMHANLAFLAADATLVEIAPKAQWYAIGPATDAALATAFAGRSTNHAEAIANPMVIVPEPARSEGLLDDERLQSIAGETVLIVAGEAGRALLADTLQARGAAVTTWTVYRRLVQPPPAGCWPMHNEVDLLVASSGQGLEILTRQWLASGEDSGGTDCFDLPVCVPSPRVFELATKLGWRKPVNCPGASASAVIAGLSQQGLWTAPRDAQAFSNSTNHTE